MKIALKILCFTALIMIFFSVSCDKECMHPNVEISKTDVSCEAAGKTEYTCPDCGYSYVDQVTPPKGHSFEKETVVPDCTSAGYTVYKCKCGYSYTADHTSAKGHDFRTLKAEADCTYCGSETHICKVCDYTYVENVGKPLGHKYSKEVVSELSCTDIGEVKYTCDVCGDSYSEYSYPQGHRFSAAVTMPTLSDMGYTKYTCEECAFTYNGDLKFYSSIVPSAYAGCNEILAQGIDVSVYNHKAGPDGGFLPLDWNAIAGEGVDYVILKAGSTYRDGGSHGGVDMTFDMDYTDAKAAGIDVGVYFYTYAKNVDQIRNDAYLLLSILEGKQFEYPIYLDLEDESLRELGADTLTEMCVEFFIILQRSGYYTGLYVNHEWLYNVINTDVALSKFDIWYARYPQTENHVWSTEEYGNTLGMWQYTDSGSLAALGEIHVDKNFSYKDYPSIIKSYGFNGYGENVVFPDDGKTFVWIKANSLTIRSDDNFDANDNVIAYANFGSRFEVLEKAENYTKILFNGSEAYISANTDYISWSPVIAIN
jgi:GH25 family lysozyme M1 (1,4-beta-N-acetylmuramidase)/transposase-like protein